MVKKVMWCRDWIGRIGLRGVVAVCTEEGNLGLIRSDELAWRIDGFATVPIPCLLRAGLLNFGYGKSCDESR